MFRRLLLFWQRPAAPLRGAPATRRLKTYTAQSGYVYHYFYLGYREPEGLAGGGVEYVFEASADRKQYLPMTVRVPRAAVESWERRHDRTLTGPERYAIAKLALFEAFDDRPKPAHLSDPVVVSGEDVARYLSTLDLV